MVLPFEPMTMTFKDLHYFVPIPKVSPAAFSATCVLTLQPCLSVVSRLPCPVEQVCHRAASCVRHNIPPGMVAATLQSLEMLPRCLHAICWVSSLYFEHLAGTAEQSRSCLLWDAQLHYIHSCNSYVHGHVPFFLGLKRLQSVQGLPTIMPHDMAATSNGIHFSSSSSLFLVLCFCFSSLTWACHGYRRRQRGKSTCTMRGARQCWSCCWASVEPSAQECSRASWGFPARARPLSWMFWLAGRHVSPHVTCCQ